MRAALLGLIAASHPPPQDGRDWMSPEERAAATSAAVLLLVVAGPEGPQILLTRRNDRLQHHAGQISFAGGRTDPQDRDAVDTALREAEEEIGLARSQVEVLGVLPEFYIPTGYRVTPVLAWLSAPPALAADPQEVAEIFYLPAHRALDPGAWQIEQVERRGGPRPVWVMYYEQRRIWGATAGMLRWLAHALQAAAAQPGV